MTRLEERGSITIWMATTSVAMTLMVGLAVDLGGQVHAQQRAHDLAAQAARAGGERVQAAPAIEGDYVRIDALAARNAATDYLSAAHVSGTVTVTSPPADVGSIPVPGGGPRPSRWTTRAGSNETCNWHSPQITSLLQAVAPSIRDLAPDLRASKTAGTSAR